MAKSAVRSAVASIPSPVFGSQPKESITQFSLRGVPPGAAAEGCAGPIAT